MTQESKPKLWQKISTVIFPRAKFWRKFGNKYHTKLTTSCDWCGRVKKGFGNKYHIFYQISSEDMTDLCFQCNYIYNQIKK